MYDKLVTKVDAIDTNGFVLKTQYNTGKLDLKKKKYDDDNKIPDVRGVVKKQTIALRLLKLKVKYLLLLV